MSRVVGWVLLVGLCTPALLGQVLSRYQYISDGEFTPENTSVCFCLDDVLEGPVHINGQAIFDITGEVGGVPVFEAPFSQMEDHVTNLAPIEYPAVFLGGLELGHDRLNFDFHADLEAIRSACLPQHRWAATLDSLPLTTLIRFDGSFYHAAQFNQTRVSGMDTLYTVPWTTLPLPSPTEAQLIWVQGVARVKGVVEGQITLLSADSLFIMGDLFTADTDTTHLDDPQRFGVAPAGSNQHIGLIGERDIIVAATLENGFANGANTPGVTCGWPNHPVIHSGGHARRDVLIHASLLALGCTVESEFWKTTAWAATTPPAGTQAHGCTGLSNQEIVVWDNEPGGILPDCPGALAGADERGTLWLNGSLALEHPGRFYRRSPSPWGSPTIGFTDIHFTYDANLWTQAPPFWPEGRWDSGLAVQWSSGTQSVCGSQPATIDFLEDWESGALSLEITAENPDELDSLAVRTWIGGTLVDREVRRNPQFNQTVTWTSSLDLSPWLQGAATVWVDVVHSDVILNVYDQPVNLHPDQSEWNQGGAECSWSLEGLSALDPAAPTGFRLSEPWPNPFNPSCQVELSLPAPGWVTLEVFDLLGRREALPHDGALAAGSHMFTLDGSRWAAGLHLLRLQHPGGAETRKLLVLK